MSPLGEETRQQILATLDEAPNPLHPLELAYRLEMHVNTVRRHLDMLESAGLVCRIEEHRDEPGRPRVVYARTCACQAPVDRSHRLLAQILTAFIAATHDDPATAGLQAGGEWGQHLVRSEPFTRTDLPTALERTFSMLADLGFAPSEPASEGTGGGSGAVAVTLGKCPFRELATAHPEVICNLHLGLIRGAQESLGSGIAITDFQSGGPDGDCTMQLERTDGTKSASVRGTRAAFADHTLAG